MAENRPANLNNDRTSLQRHGEIPHLFVFTDIGKDIDDLIALLFLAQLHKEKRVKIVGVITSITPALKRAKLLRRIFERMGLGSKEIPIAYGTDGTDEKNSHAEEKYEFDHIGELTLDLPIWNDVNKKDYIEFGVQILQDADKSGKKLRVLVLTSSQDVNTVAQANRALFDKVVTEVHMQGGLTKDEDDEWIADPKDAQNMRFNSESTMAFWQILQENKSSLSWAVYTKYAATKCPFYIEDFATESVQMGGVGKYMQQVSSAQNFEFFRRALINQYTQDVQDIEWFINIRTTLKFDQVPPFDTSLPKEEAVRRLWDFVSPHATLVPYDAIAAVGCVSDVLEDGGGLGFGLKNFALDESSTKFLVGQKALFTEGEKWKDIYPKETVSLAIKTSLCKALDSQVKGK